ncbi:ABC transporter substrate-binding protein [Roseomonas xinghualingensis]|uniref:ABC transporter substrate-binding protein n=1 Tax=Roseomonas xinghualingensis TaxID=2986475 RepID=UPI0021F0FA2B|nr:ABC transporter substrate-binding protein [Roseomonas sp. SXEYE001]MCV4207235.1 ABC transporter substrate-binding protein [Roseomonas sp. SXEYE001]
MIGRRLFIAGGAVLAAPRILRAQAPLRVGDQRGNARAVMEASGQLARIADRIAWSEFPAAAPLVEALNAGAIDTGLVGDAPFTFGAAAGVPIKAIAATRENRGGLAIIVPKDSPVQSFADLKGKRIATGRGSIGHQVVLAALEDARLPFDAVRFVFVLPADAKAAYASGAVDAWATWEPYVSQEEVLAGARRIVSGERITPGLLPGSTDGCHRGTPAGAGGVRPLPGRRSRLGECQCRWLCQYLVGPDEYSRPRGSALVRACGDARRADRRYRGGGRTEEYRPLYPRRPCPAPHRGAGPARRLLQRGYPGW